MPDPRLDVLAEIFGSAAIAARRRCPSSTSPASSGAHRRAQGLGNKFLANIREADAICQVIRVFDDPDVVHVDGKVDPGRRHRDDQHRADPRRPADAREGAAAAGEGGADQQGPQPRCWPPSSRRARSSTRGTHAVRAPGLDLEPLRELHLLTAKPFLYVFNVDDDELGNEPSCSAELRALVAPAEAIFLDAKIESELVELRRRRGARAAAVDRPGRVRAGTSWPASASTPSACRPTSPPGPKESRAWTIHKGDTAPEAAGVIHTDFQRGFIKAEVVSFDDLVEAGSMAEAQVRAARSGSRARTTSWPTATSWSSASTCRRCPRVVAVYGLPGLRLQHVTRR